MRLCKPANQKTTGSVSKGAAWSITSSHIFLPLGADNTEEKKKQQQTKHQKTPQPTQAKLITSIHTAYKSEQNNKSFHVNEADKNQLS